MATSPGEWLEEQSDRILARQRAQADNAKLLATFAGLIAATLTASALLLANRKPSAADWVAVSLLAVAVLLAGLVALFDRMSEPNHRDVLKETRDARNEGTPWSDDRLLRRLRKAAVKAVKINERWVRCIKAALWPQLLFALGSSAAAVVSMLTG